MDEGVDVAVEPWDDLEQALRHDLSEHVAANRPVHSLGGQVFRYIFARTVDEPDSSIWILEFWQCVGFVAFTRRDL